MPSKSTSGGFVFFLRLTCSIFEFFPELHLQGYFKNPLQHQPQTKGEMTIMAKPKKYTSNRKSNTNVSPEKQQLLDRGNFSIIAPEITQQIIPMMLANGEKGVQRAGLLYFYLVGYVNNMQGHQFNGYAYPTVSQIVKDLGISRGNVKPAVDLLEKYGLVETRTITHVSDGKVTQQKLYKPILLPECLKSSEKPQDEALEVSEEEEVQVDEFEDTTLEDVLENEPVANLSSSQRTNTKKNANKSDSEKPKDIVEFEASDADIEWLKQFDEKFGLVSKDDEEEPVAKKPIPEDIAPEGYTQEQWDAIAPQQRIYVLMDIENAKRKMNQQQKQPEQSTGVILSFEEQLGMKRHRKAE